MTVYKEENEGDIMMQKLVSYLKQEMIRQRIGVNQLAEDSGVSNATVSRIINLKTYPNFGTMYKLFMALEMEIELEVAGWTLDGAIRKF